MEKPDTNQEARFRTVFRRLHEGHATCLKDEWLMEPCRGPDGNPLERPWVWSRRNGPWRRVDILWIGAAPGNAGGRGRGNLGAHGTRVPFGGDVAGANLEALLGSVGTNRNETFIAAALNRLPDSGGGEPKNHELRAPAGGYRDSIDLLRDTVVAAGPSLIVVLGNVAARALAGAWLQPEGERNLPSLATLEKAGWNRGRTVHLADLGPPGEPMAAAWSDAWGREAPAALRLMHPSAQNMSPFAGRETAFHKRMLEARDTLKAAVSDVLGWSTPQDRPEIPETGIYSLPEWREPILPRLARMDRLWRDRDV